MILTILTIILLYSLYKQSKKTREYNRRIQEREEERNLILMRLVNTHTQQNDIRLYVEEQEMMR